MTAIYIGLLIWIAVFLIGSYKAILLVGSQASGKMEVVNAFQGQEAIDIYEKLNKKKETKNV